MPRIVQKPKTVLELGDVDISRLKARVQMLSEAVWQQEDELKENRFDCFHSTDHIVFRFTPGNVDASYFYETQAWAMWKPILLPIMDAVSAYYGYSNRVYCKAMFARLRAGQVIDRHVDGAGSNVHCHKIHVPLQTNPKAVFYAGDEGFYLEEGKAYEVNNVRMHGVENHGDEDRIHFIFEVFDDVDNEAKPQAAWRTPDIEAVE